MRSNTLMCATGALLALSSTAFAQTANEDQTLFAPAANVDDFFGWDVDVDGDLMVSSAFGVDGLGLDEGAAFLYERDANGDWVLVQQLLTTTVLNQGDLFGYSVAIDNGRIAVGAVLDDDTGPQGDSGAVYIFEETTPGSWTETAKLFSTTPTSQGQFGYDVDLSGDRLAVGSRGDNQFRGALFVFDYDPIGMMWGTPAKLTAADAAVDDRLGQNVAIQGDRVVACADLDDYSALTDVGSAYVWEWVPALMQWRSTGKLVPPTPNTNDAFGTDVAIEGDFVYVGAPAEDSTAPAAANAGGVFVYERVGVQNWAFVDVIYSANPEVSGQFGAAVDVDGDNVFIGANGDDGDPAVFTGAAYLVEKQAGNTFQEIQRFAGSDLVVDMNNDFFADRVAISGDNLVAGWTAATDPSSASTNAGATCTFTIGTLYHGDPTISVSSGGEQGLFIRAGSAVAGQPYIILGSGNGTSPGTPDAVSGITIPLNFDSYFLTILNGAGAGLVGPWLGFLDANGNADAKFGIPAGTSASLAGTELWHGIITIDVFVTGLLSSASNPVKVTLIL